MPGPDAITCGQLLSLIGTADCPAIGDISTGPDFAEDPVLIPGSVRHPHTDASGLLSRLAGRRCVVACQLGLKLSQGMAAWLRAQWIAAEYLEGGIYAWREHPGAPRIPAAAIPRPGPAAQRSPGTLWVTRHRPMIDRIACPWLIHRFVNPGARVLFVSPSEVMGVADRYGATAFDAPGAEWWHEGELCTFDAMLDRFALRIEALDHVSVVVRAAHTNRHDLAPEAAGLLAISVGLSRQHRDDLAQLEAGMILYDALYRWARDGAEETHDDGHHG